MNCLRNSLLSASLFLVLGLGAVAPGQSFTAPFLTEFPDGSRCIGWNASGGEAGVYPVLRPDGSVGYGLFNRPTSTLWSVGDCKPVLSWIQESIMTPTPVFRNIRMLSARREATTKQHLTSRLQSFTLPGCDIDLKESRGIELEHLAAIDTRLLAHELTHVIQQSSKRQKAWLCSNFRLRIGDLSTEKVVRTEKIKFKQEFGPSQATKKNSLEDPWTPSEFVFYIPNSDRKRVDEENVKALDGNPTLFTVQLEYLDSDGTPMLTLRFPATIQAVGLADPFADPTDPDAKVKVVMTVNLSKQDDLNGLIR